MKNHLQRIDDDAGFEMLIMQQKRIAEIEDQKEVTLLESRRKAEWDKREEARLLQKNRFRASQGLDLLTSDKEQEDQEQDEAETEATRRIQLDEAARILADSIINKAPLSVMR
jgi:carboxyl-terminal processing protease